MSKPQSAISRPGKSGANAALRVKTTPMKPGRAAPPKNIIKFSKEMLNGAKIVMNRHTMDVEDFAPSASLAAHGPRVSEGERVVDVAMPPPTQGAESFLPCNNTEGSTPPCQEAALDTSALASDTTHSCDHEEDASGLAPAQAPPASSLLQRGTKRPYISEDAALETVQEEPLPGELVVALGVSEEVDDTRAAKRARTEDVTPAHEEHIEELSTEMKRCAPAAAQAPALASTFTIGKSSPKLRRKFTLRKAQEDLPSHNEYSAPSSTPSTQIASANCKKQPVSYPLHDLATGQSPVSSPSIPAVLDAAAPTVQGRNGQAADVPQKRSKAELEAALQRARRNVKDILMSTTRESKEYREERDASRKNIKEGRAKIRRAIERLESLKEILKQHGLLQLFDGEGYGAVVEVLRSDAVETTLEGERRSAPVA